MLRLVARYDYAGAAKAAIFAPLSQRALHTPPGTNSLIDLPSGNSLARHTHNRKSTGRRLQNPPHDPKVSPGPPPLEPRRPEEV